MPPSSTSSLARWLTLVPSLYLAQTRIKGAKDFAYLVASSFVPAIWIAYRLADLDLVGATIIFIAGYLCFIAVYELGYLANDVWDARKDPTGRQRLGFTPGPLYLAAFVLIRLAAWALIALQMGWLGSEVFLACYAALIAAFAQHNLIRSAAFRSASFYQLSLLRFVAPIIAVLEPRAVMIALIAAALLYSYFRFLSYLESKNLLDMPERRRPDFGLVQAAMLLPLILFVSFASDSFLLLELGCYFLAVFALWRLLAKPSVQT